MKKKVIALVVTTELTNEEIEDGEVELLVRERPLASRGHTPPARILPARNVRVLDSDESSS